MNLFICFFPMFCFAIAGAMAFGVHSYNTYKQSVRRKLIPKGNWFVSYSNNEIIGD